MKRIRLVSILIFLLINVGCSIPKHEVRYEALKVQRETFSEMADSWAVNWFRQILPYLAGTAGVSTLAGYLGLKKGKNGNDKKKTEKMVGGSS